jgi:hypothetical protein
MPHPTVSVVEALRVDCVQLARPLARLASGVSSGR